IIEGGFPIASAGDFEAVQAISDAVKGAKVAALCRCRPKDIEAGGKALERARYPVIHTFLATSALHLKWKLKITPEDCLRQAVEAVTLARTFVEEVEFSAEDASRTDYGFLKEVLQAVHAAGAKTLNVPDTVGYALPAEYAEMVRKLVRDIPTAVISVHCHNDLGLGVANSLAAVGAGARQVECTVNGLGERAGNAAMEEIVMALKTRHDRMPFTTGVKSEYITRASRLVSAITGFVVQPNKAIVGANAFAHESGIHQDGMLKHAGTYEIMTPESVGLGKSTLVMGKHSGRHAFKAKLKELGFEIGDNAMNEAFKRFKDLADRKKDVYDEDIVALIDDESQHGTELIKFVSLQVIAGSRGPQNATLELEVDGKKLTAMTNGNGPVDATFNAIKALVPNEAKLLLYQVSAVTHGTEAQAEVTVRLEEDGKTVNGQGAEPDTLVASARAYIHALNKLMVKR